VKQIETDVGKRLTTPQQIALRALKQAIDEHGQEAPDSNRVPANVSVTTKNRWREYAYQLGISPSDKDRAKQQAFKRATEDLLEAKRIGTWGEFFWVITE
jgi:hypothetical protein